MQGRIVHVRSILGLQRKRQLYVCAVLGSFLTLYLVNVLLLYEEALGLFPLPLDDAQRAGPGQQGSTSRVPASSGTPIKTAEGSEEVEMGGEAGAQLPSSVTNDHWVSSRRIGVFLPLLGLKPVLSVTSEEHTERRRRIERLALQGWRLAAETLHARSSFLDVHIYAVLEDAAHCDSAWEPHVVGSQFTCLVLPIRCLHPDYVNTPTLDCIFDMMAKIAGEQQYDYVVFANGDLLFPPQAFAVSMVSLMARHEDTFVLVGQRTDTTWHEFAGHAPETEERRPLSLETYDSLHANARAPSHGALRHPDFGVDYFVMSAHLIPADFPPFLVGRFRWDNALLAQFLAAVPSVAVVDATSVLPVVHLGEIYSSNPEYHYNRVGAEYNDALASEYSGQSYKLGRIHNAAWRLEEVGGLGKAKFELQPRLPQARPDHALLLALSRAGGGPLLLLTVLPHELMHALEWLRDSNQARNTSWFYTHYLFVVLDQETHDALEAAAPGCVILEDMMGWPHPPTALSWQSFEKLLNLRAMPVAVLSATTLQRIGLLTDQLTAYADKAATCSAVVLQDSNELLSVDPRVKAGMTFWRHYKARSGNELIRRKGEVCLV